LEQEPAAAAVVFCPYFPVQSWFQRLVAIADRVLTVPFDQAWVSRPQQSRFERIGPERWSACFVSVPARASVFEPELRPAPSPEVSHLSVAELLRDVELPANIESLLSGI
jgi:hypothetical protein